MGGANGNFIKFLVNSFLLYFHFQDKETGFHRGMGWVQFSSREELQSALQQENHIIDGVKVSISVDICSMSLFKKQLVSYKVAEESKRRPCYFWCEGLTPECCT